jgi:hypothetical protein
MRSFVFFAHALIGSISLQAQSPFQRVYIGSGGGQLLELPNGNILTRITHQNGISMMDNEGHIIYSRSYAIDSLLGIATIRSYSEDELVFASGFQKDSCSHSGSMTIPYTCPVVGRMDLSGNVHKLRHFRLNGSGCWGFPMDLVVSSTKDVITWGLAPAFYALRTDSSLAPRWAKQFNYEGSFQFIKELPGGDLLAGINMDTAGAVVARMNADGNFLWCKSYIRPLGMVHDAVIESDDSFIITGVTESSTSQAFTPLPSTYHPKLFMMKLDGDGEVQWCRGYDNSPYRWYAPQQSRIEKTMDGNYAVLATIGVHDNGLNYNSFQRPFLMKTDMNGDTLWTRSIDVNGYSCFTLDLLTSSDGGYLFDGHIWGDLPDNNTGAPYIFKADSEGHFSCHEYQLPIQSMDLFPVASSFVLSSNNGTTVDSAFVNDIAYPPISTYDACVVTSIPRYTRQYPNRPSVRPNPNTGRFTVQFQDPLVAESYYSVYDPLGKLMLQRKLPTGATVEEVDLSRYGEGTYVVKFTSPQGVCHERVVVE